MPRRVAAAAPLVEQDQRQDALSDGGQDIAEVRPPVASLASCQPLPPTQLLHPTVSQAASVSDYTYPSPADSIHRRDDEEEDSEEEEAGLAREDEADEVRRDLGLEGDDGEEEADEEGEEGEGEEPEAEEEADGVPHGRGRGSLPLSIRYIVYYDLVQLPSEFGEHLQPSGP
jgi:hypothetical protein